MARSKTKLVKKSLVVDGGLLRELVKVGDYRNASEAVRDAVLAALVTRAMRDVVAELRVRWAAESRARTA
jgi:Arc/MetJ-type ribon-helix-helix transcriptional regulator